MTTALGAAQITSAPAKGVEARQQFLTFALLGRSYGVPLTQVAEITPQRTLNRIPHMPKGIEGLLDLRGTVLPVLNLRIRLDLQGDHDAPQENIIILDLGGSRLGVLVDKVQSVVDGLPEQISAASPLLAGPDGAWVSGFLRLGDRIVVLLDVAAISVGGPAAHHAVGILSDIDRKLDEDLQHLLELAPPKAEVDAERHRIMPQIEVAIHHTEEEVAKVIDRIESMLVDTDKAFKAIVTLKQEARLGRLKDLETQIAELDRVGTRLQDVIFDTIHQLQFQDIARQKLERVLKHIQGMQSLIGQRLRDVDTPT